MSRLPEEQRLAALHAYGVLDTPPEDAFDDLAKLAARICETPIALVSLVDRDRQWFKACVGIDARETPRAVAFCAYALERDEPLVVPDARSDARFCDNPLVTGPPRIRFYTGFPLVDDEGAALGTLCVIDTVPRVLNDLQMGTLRVLAHQVVAQLRLRKVSQSLRAELVRSKAEARAREEEQAAELARVTSMRGEIELAHRRASFLADAGKLLAESLDANRTLEAVAQLAVPSVADVCSIMLCEEDGTLRRVADAGSGALEAAEMRALREQTSGDAPLAMKEAIAEQRPVLFADLPKWLAERLPAGHPYLAIVARLGVVSGISAPMIVGGRVEGVLSVAIQADSRTGRPRDGERTRRYDEDDLETMRELAQRAAVALENARLLTDARAQRARAEQANRTKDAFLAAVSHDLRTPLNAIVGWTQILREKSGDPKLQARAIEVIDRSARAQSRLIEDLLDLSRIAEGKLHVEREPVDLVSVVDFALDALRPLAATRGVRIETNCHPDAKHGIGDFGRLQQVVWNLVSNAIKFSKREGRIDISLERDGERAKLIVKDDGRGIRSELLPHIFQRFRQDETGIGRRAGGLGLGLAIAKHIVEAVGGEIRAHSDGDGQGAIFTVHLPLSSASPSSTRALTIAARLAFDVDTSTAQQLQNTRILLVDDDPDTRAALAELLTSRGMIVTTAENAEGAFDLFVRERPDLLVSDVVMTGASGYDLVRQVRDLPPQDGGRTPSLALTANVGAIDRTRALAAGFDFYVPKPIEPSELLAVLTALRARGK